MKSSFATMLFAVGLLHAAACSKAEPGSVYVLNGFDFPVKAELKAEHGNVTLDIPARGMVRTSVSGDGTARVTTASGGVVVDGPASFGRKPPDGCVRLYNIQGGAAVVDEAVDYGESYGTPRYSLQAGQISDEYCGIRWAFEQPPESITVTNAGAAGRSLGWLHYVGDGGWVTSVTELLEMPGEFRSQYRGAAQRIVGVVVAHDPTNPALASLQERFATEGLVFPDGSR